MSSSVKYYRVKTRYRQDKAGAVIIIGLRWMYTYNYDLCGVLDCTANTSGAP